MLETFVAPNGTLSRALASRKKRWVVLAWLVRRIEDGRRFTEAEFSARKSPHHGDFATLRREQFGCCMMARAASVYWRLPESDWVAEAG